MKISKSSLLTLITYLAIFLATERYQPFRSVGCIIYLGGNYRLPSRSCPAGGY